MFKLPDIRSLDFSRLDFSGIDFSGLDLSSLDLNALRNVNLPTVKFPTVDTAKLTNAVRDAAYIAVGLGVTAVERAQARRQQLMAIVNDRVDAARGLVHRAA
jgi:hypothetical protein